MMKIVHFSDPHGGGPAEDWSAYFDKRWVGVFNYRFRRRFRHDLSRLSRAVEYVMATRPDAVVCTGDLTSAGQPGEFSKVLEILRPLRDSAIPLIYTPGNHDCYVRNPKCVAAVQNAMTFLAKDAPEQAALPCVRRIGDLDFLVVSTSAPSNLLCSWGFLKKQDRDFILSYCAEKEHARPRVLVTHYPMIEAHPWLRLRHRLFGQKEILRAMAEKRIDLTLCGHVHRPGLRVDETGRGECCAGSVTRNGTMTEITWDPETRRFTFQEIKL